MEERGGGKVTVRVAGSGASAKRGSRRWGRGGNLSAGDVASSADENNVSSLGETPSIPTERRAWERKEKPRKTPLETLTEAFGT